MTGFTIREGLGPDARRDRCVPSLSGSPGLELDPDSTLRPWRGRLVVLAGIVLAAFNLRIAVAAVSPILDVVRVDIDLSDQLAGLLGTVPVIAFAVFGSLVPALSRRFGLEPTLVGALLVSAVGRSCARCRPRPLVPGGDGGRARGHGDGQRAPPTAGQALLPRPDRGGDRRLYRHALPEHRDPAAPRGRHGVVAGLASRAGWVGSRGPRRGRAVDRGDRALGPGPGRALVGAGALARAHRRPRRAPPSRGRAWRSPLAWGIAVMFGLNSLNTYVMFAWLPHVLVDSGMAEPVAASALALYAFVGMPMSIVTPCSLPACATRTCWSWSSSGCSRSATADSWASRPDPPRGVGRPRGLGASTFPWGSRSSTCAAALGRGRRPLGVRAGRGVSHRRGGAADGRDPLRAQRDLDQHVRVPVRNARRHPDRGGRRVPTVHDRGLVGPPGSLGGARRGRRRTALASLARIVG
ncbi:hypothetical protein NKG05_21670 [Oerskovia sp. M15]